jgi:hypothetical protein
MTHCALATMLKADGTEPSPYVAPVMRTVSRGRTDGSGSWRASWATHGKRRMAGLTMEAWRGGMGRQSDRQDG